MHAHEISQWLARSTASKGQAVAIGVFMHEEVQSTFRKRHAKHRALTLD